MSRGIIPLFIFVLALCLALPKRAAAGAFEFSLGFSFKKSNYTGQDYSWTRTWGTSVGYHFTERSGVELAFQDVVDRTRIENYEDTTFHDRILSANWIQSLLGKNSPVQPYAKIGVGQLMRDAEGTYFGGAARPARQVDSVSAVMGAGMRIYIKRSFAIRIEGTSYLNGGSIATWQDNVNVTFGTSIFF